MDAERPVVSRRRMSSQGHVLTRRYAPGLWGDNLVPTDFLEGHPQVKTPGFSMVDAAVGPGGNGC